MRSSSYHEYIILQTNLTMKQYLDHLIQVRLKDHLLVVTKHPSGVGETKRGELCSKGKYRWLGTGMLSS